MNIEKRTIEFIPEEERHGSVRNLFTIWFSANMQVTTLVTGALAIEFGLSIFWGLIAVVVGNLLGAIFMASHSVQGPKLGIPQMIQSRAQFGVVGAVIPLFVVILMYIGFFASSSVLGAQAISSAFSIPVNWGIVLVSIIALVITMIGYDLIHKLERYFAIIFAIVFIFVTVEAFRLQMPAHIWSPGHFSVGSFLLMVSIAATWQLTYAPYVADYSRYLPSNTPSSKTFGYTYAGTVIGTVWMMSLGVILTALIPKFLDNSSLGLAKLVGPQLAVLMYMVIVLGVLAVNVLNLYGAFMSITTTLEAFTKLKATTKVRFWLVFATALIGTGLAIWGNGNFLTNFENFILLLSYFMVPWTAINLIDYYLLRRGEYNVLDVFDVNGQYGKFNWIAIIAYLVSFILEIPFVNTTMYVGPISKILDGTDIAWIMGLVAPLVLYYYPMRKKINLSVSNEVIANKQ
ncbi:purine-cytosine permease family protein [Neobacillus ginsengisoli]|uniref:NCS1 family nucleobase:cation symporter-1 n=1 Tax=Neobacillus ginsengisoli TaxID=904295 RepID=A0ABT9Y2H0_9BACI|nr:cytosine permease [Neobacillus ginsengisoli]MDQ0202011.1 NCS1 family nucleobase:cation symporter-1 [Neobacillus ginsengisoli]